MNELTITTKEWNDDLAGYCCKLNNGTYFQVQFEIELNCLDANFGEWYPILDKQNDYGLALTENEEDDLQRLISQDK